MVVIWLNATVGAGKSAVGQALTRMSSATVFMDGDDYAGPRDLPNPVRWRMALNTLLRAVAHRSSSRRLVVAYPIDRQGYQQLQAACARAHRALFVINLATPLPITLRGRSGRILDPAERARARAMRSKGFHRRPFAAASVSNTQPTAAGTARKIGGLVSRLTNPARAR